MGCACPNSACTSQTCDHVYLFDNDYEDAKDIYGKPMRGRFPYDERGRLVLEVKIHSFDYSFIFFVISRC